MVFGGRNFVELVGVWEWTFGRGRLGISAGEMGGGKMASSWLECWEAFWR